MDMSIDVGRFWVLCPVVHVRASYVRALHWILYLLLAHHYHGGKNKKHHIKIKEICLEIHVLLSHTPHIYTQTHILYLSSLQEPRFDPCVCAPSVSSRASGGGERRREHSNMIAVDDVDDISPNIVYVRIVYFVLLYFILYNVIWIGKELRINGIDGLFLYLILEI